MTRRTPRLDAVVLIIGVLIVGALAFSRGSAPQPHASVFSTYDTGPNGYRALYEVLAGAGVPVRRFERVLGALDPSIKTLVITAYEDDLAAKPLDEHDKALLKQFVENGGRLVAFDTDFAGSEDVTPGVGTTGRTPIGGDAVALARNNYTAGVNRVRGKIEYTFYFAQTRGVPLLANSQGMVAVLYRVGRGEVIAVSAPVLFGNAGLRSADNLRFAYNMVAGHGLAAFDEYVHGYDDDLSLWAVLPAPVRYAVWIVVAIVLIALIGANVPFAPPYLQTAPDERDSSDYITAIAELMRRSHRRAPDDDVVWQAAIDFRHRKERA
ncbi:MAG TPA: DUF4350 domain-containing protein [Candidatus Nitrosotalea sp.]|nr:DUF4350 domain-containing protein [Candidatus Nitrosotalea sp.]